MLPSTVEPVKLLRLRLVVLIASLQTFGFAIAGEVIFLYASAGCLGPCSNNEPITVRWTLWVIQYVLGGVTYSTSIDNYSNIGEAETFVRAIRAARGFATFVIISAAVGPLILCLMRQCFAHRFRPMGLLLAFHTAGLAIFCFITFGLCLSTHNTGAETLFGGQTGAAMVKAGPFMYFIPGVVDIVMTALILVVICSDTPHPPQLQQSEVGGFVTSQMPQSIPEGGTPVVPYGQAPPVVPYGQGNYLPPQQGGYGVGYPPRSNEPSYYT